MTDAMIVSTARTPIGKAYRGALNATEGATLLGHAIGEAVARAKVDPKEVEDVVMGAAMQQGTTGGNIARKALLRAGLPVTVGGTTIDRQCASGLQGAKRLGGNSLFDLLVFGQRAGEYAAKVAKENSPVSVSDAEIEAAYREAVEPFERAGGGSTEGPYQVQYDLQNLMQSNVGIVRLKNEMEQALDGIAKLKTRAAKVAVQGHREYNPGWHTAIDLKHLLTVSEAIATCSLDRKESRGGHFREDFPAKDPEAAKYNSVVSKAADGSMKLRREPIAPMPEALKQVIEEMK